MRPGDGSTFPPSRPPVDGAGELDQYAVAGDLEDAALVFGNQRLL